MEPAKPKCGQCGSETILPVVYGLPTAETLARAIRGEVLLGGCVVFGNEPDWRCASCGAAVDLSEFAPQWVKDLIAEASSSKRSRRKTR
jgi:hypothetical protein